MSRCAALVLTVATATSCGSRTTSEHNSEADPTTSTVDLDPSAIPEAVGFYRQLGLRVEPLDGPESAPRQRWSAPLTGVRDIAVVPGSVMAIVDDEKGTRIVAFDSTSGEITWQIDTDSDASIVGNDNVSIWIEDCCDRDETTVRALDIASGVSHWDTATGCDGGTRVVTNHRIVLSCDSSITILDSRDGSTVGSIEGTYLEHDPTRIVASLDCDLIVASIDSADELARIDRADDCIDVDDSGFLAPVHLFADTLVAHDRGDTVGWSVTTGDEMWRFAGGGDFLAAGDVLISATAGDDLSARRVDDGSRIPGWKADDMGWNVEPRIAFGAHVLFPDSEAHTLGIVDLSTGDALAERTIGQEVQTSTLSTKLFITADAGELTAIELPSLESRWTLEIDFVPEYAGVGQGMLVVGSDERITAYA